MDCGEKPHGGSHDSAGLLNKNPTRFHGFHPWGEKEKGMLFFAAWPQPLLVLQVSLVEDALRRSSCSAPGRCASKDTDSFWNSYPC